MAEKKGKAESTTPVDRAIEDLFSAKLEMTTIHPKVVRYRVTHHKGLGVIGLHHVEIDRRNFPKDDDFNMGFIDMKLPKDASEKDLKKQAGFRMYKNLSIKISTV